ncbi:MAG: M23 family metallopeptidase [Gemmatimonadetes bacterium]|nr:M23 family metallopeptidase [Gemmatimonadota bacterium]
MARRQWTLLLVPDDHTSSRQFRVSRELVQVAIAGGLVLFSLLASLVAGLLVQESRSAQSGRLVQENAVLQTELQRMHSQAAQLKASLDELGKRDEQYRLIAGLEPIDEEVREAGIGGPGTETLESNELWRVDPELGEAAFTTAYDLNAMTRRARLLSSSWREATETLRRKHQLLAATPSILPTRGVISSAFSRQRWHPILDRPRAHEGIDIVARRGTPILAAANGRVTYVGRQADYGLMVEVDHGYGRVTRYAHASRALARPGQLVRRGEKIGEVGDTGLAIGPHLHYEVLVDGRPTNPRRFIFDRDVLAE